MSLSRLGFLAAVAVSITFALRTWVVEFIYVATGSMEPTYHVGQRLWSDKITLRERAPKRGDVVVFPSPIGEDIDLVKRVIALPGETVELREKKVLINGKEFDEPYAVHKRGAERLVGDDIGPLTVPPDGLFVLGDNRDESEDSTVWKDKNGQPIYFIKTGGLKGLVRDPY
ncbi:MAG: signal peptidase I [Elusimicrobia bacterium]|nr:signal peptidase I [Elusimicrobiota bacterium]